LDAVEDPENRTERREQLAWIAKSSPALAPGWAFKRAAPHD
jgi:hypothetical protein